MPLRRSPGLPGDKVQFTTQPPPYTKARIGDVVTISDLEVVVYGRISNYGRKSGLYRNPTWPVVQTSDGRQFSISATYLAPLPGAEHRMVEMNDMWMAPLPETAFYEMDRVRFGNEECEVMSILLQTPSVQQGRIFEMESREGYRIQSVTDGAVMEATREELELVERGNVWRREAGEALIFEGLTDEILFWAAVGDNNAVPNPYRPDAAFAYTEEERLQAIHDGHGDFILSELPAANPRRHDDSVYRLRNRDVGERIRAAFLDEVVMPAPQAAL